jgi:parallel beta-helix repeat protein
MARDYDAYLRATQAAQADTTSKQGSEIQGLPPGYLEGGRLILKTDYSVTVDPIVCNVRGLLVKRTDTYTLAEADFVCNRLASIWYYVYLLDDGRYKADLIAPVFNTADMGRYHPDYGNYRNIGKLYIGSSQHTLYCQTVKTGATSELLVAASTYTGENADYECTGDNDQVLIQAAIDYLAEAHGGGVVRLTEGTFYTADAIYMRSNVTLAGRGANSIIEKNCDDYAIDTYGASGAWVSDSVIRDLAVTANSADEYAKALVHYWYARKCFIMNCIAYGGHDFGIHSLNSESLNILNCIVHGCNSYGIYLGGDAVSGNIINTEVYQNYGGIATVSSDYWKISECYAHDNTHEGIYITSGSQYALLDGNKVENNVAQDVQFRSTVLPIGDSHLAGIRVGAGSANIRVSNNDCRNNGTLLDHGACTGSAPHIKDDAYSVANAGWAISSDQAYSGTTSFKHTITATATVSKARFCDNETTTDMHGLYAGQTYELSGYVYVPSTGGPAAAEVKIHFEYYNAGTWTSAGVAATGQDAWELVTSGEIAIPSTATGIRAYVSIAATASNGEFVYWDNFRLKPVGTHNLHSQNFSDAGTGTLIG